MKLGHERVRLGLGKGCAPEGGGHGMAAQGSGRSPELLELKECLDFGWSYEGTGDGLTDH